MLLQQVGYLIHENEVTGCCGKVHTEQLRDLYSPRNVTAMIRSKRKRRTGYVACKAQRIIMQVFG